MSITIIGNPVPIPAQEVSPPPLTGCIYTDTINALNAQRLQVIMQGPAVNYELHGHKCDWGTWLKELDDRIFAAMKQRAQMYPFEFVSGGGYW